MARNDQSASAEELEQLHAAFAAYLNGELTKQRKEGETVPTNLLSTIRQFLSDNDIQASRASGHIQSMVRDMPEFDDEAVEGL